MHLMQPNTQPVSLAGVHHDTVDRLLFIYCIVCGDFVLWSLLKYLCVLSCFASISLRKRDLVAFYLIAVTWLLLFCGSSSGAVD